MKKTTALLLAALMLISLAACRGNGKPDPDITDGSDPTDSPYETPASAAEKPEALSPLDPETDFDNRFGTFELFGLAETDDVYYWSPKDCGFLIYYDKEADEYAPVCGKPECEHIKEGNVWYSNESCDAFICAEGSISIYEGKIWYFTYAKTSGWHWLLRRMDPDGTHKETVLELDIPESFNPQRFWLHRGRIYGFCLDNDVADGVPRTKVRIITTPVDRLDLTVIYERSSFHLPYCRLRFMRQYCYIFTMYSDEETKEGLSQISRWSSETGELESLFDGPDFGSVYIGWVDEDMNMYFTPPMLRGEANMSTVIKFSDGEWSEFMDFCDPNGDFVWPSVADGIVFAFRGEGMDEYPPSPDREIWIKRFDGETLYKGKLPMEWLESADPRATFISCIFSGDESAVIAQYEVRWRNATHQNEARAFYLVKYDITPNGLEESVMGYVYDKIMIEDFG